MQKIITLSTGEEVTFRPDFTHDAETIYCEARERGVVDKEYIENGELKIVRERPVKNYADAIRETLLYMIASVKNGESESKPNREWLGGMALPDYLDLAEALAYVRTETDERIAAGKKNR